MTVYESNLKNMSEKAPDIYNKLISDAPPLFNVEIEKTDDQNNDRIIYNNCKCFVNSIYDIEAEMSNMVKNVDADTEIFVVFGLANGHILTYLQKHFRKLNTIHVIEPSLDIFKNLLSKHIFVDLITRSDTKVSITLDRAQEEMGEYLARVFLTNKNIVFIEHISYRTVFKSYYQQLSYMIVEYLRTHRFNIRTLNSMYLTWAKSSIVNCRYKSFMVDNLFKYIEGKPAVIVSAGPSLKKNMHLLNQLKEKAIIFAGGSTVRVLAKNNITPSFRASIDALAYQNVIFQDVEDDNVPLLFRNMSNTELVKKYQGPKFRAIIEDDNIWQYICDKKGLQKNVLSASPSVSNFLFEVLIAAKCDPIIFVGQDMCSYGDAKYADSSENSNLIKMQKEMEMVDINGVKVTTELNYLQIKYSFDRQAKKCNARLINATEGGLGIEGTEVKTLESVLKEDLTEELDFDIDEIVEIEQLKSTYEVNYTKVQEALQEMKEESKEAAGVLIEVFRSIDNYSRLKANNYKEGKLLKEIEKIDKLYKKLMENKFFADVVTKSTISIIQALDIKYNYSGTDKIKLADNKAAKAASHAEIFFKYIKEFAMI